MSTTFDPTPDAAKSPSAAPKQADRPQKKAAKENLRQEPGPKKISIPLNISITPSLLKRGYVQQHLSLDLNSLHQRIVAKLLLVSLVAENAQLNNGTRVERPEHAIQWLLEEIASNLNSKILDRLKTIID